MIITSIFVMYRDYYLAQENYEILQSESGVRVAVIRPTPMSIFAKGLDANLCRSYEVGGGNVEVGRKQQSVNKIFMLFTTPDLLYIVKIILSLCAMLFAFDVVCGEKEIGTLRQSLSNNLKRPILIIGKWIGGFVSFILPFFLAVILGAIFVTLSPMVDMNAQNWAKLGLFLLSSVIYLAVFFSLGLFISCLTHRSSTSLVVSLFAWIILAFLIPNLGNILARQFVRIPSALQLKQIETQIDLRYNAEVKRDESKSAETRARMEIELNKITEDYRNRFDRLVKLSRYITRISPAAVFTFLATDIMGTGLLEEGRLKRAILQHAAILKNWDREKGDRPAFSFKRSSVKEVLGPKSLGNCFILIVFNILFFTGAYVGFLRYDVR
jgi:ABC-type transport system involved in multi-copper enzyme maturation permease subunit